MDIWEKMYDIAKKEYHPEAVSPFIDAHHVVCAIEAEDGKIYTGFCIEGACGVMSLCAERVAALNMYIQSGQTGACREFFMQLSTKNKDMEILTDYETRTTVKLEDVYPNWWGWKRF